MCSEDQDKADGAAVDNNASNVKDRIHLLRNEIWKCAKSFHQMGEFTLRDLTQQFLDKDKADHP